MGKEQELLDAARAGNVALIEKILSQRKWTAGPLALPLPPLQIRKGAHPNCQDTNGETPLHHASLNGHKEVVELLLKLQASANIPDQRGCFPLHLSAWRGNADVCRVLLSHGPSLSKVNAQNLEGDTALHSAAQYGHNQVVDLLLQKSADPLIKNSKGERALDLAIQYGRLETVQLLLQAVKVKDLASSDDKPPLLLAAKSGNKQVLQILLDAGFDINQKSTNGTVLHEACMYGRLEIVKLLLEKGVDVTVKDSADKTAVDLLNVLNTPISLEIYKAINDHINPPIEASNARESVSSEFDYDYLPPSKPTRDGDGPRNRLLSQDSSDSCMSQKTAADQEESIYDHPRAFQGKLNYKAGGTNSSFKKDLPPKSPDTPKKPPRKRPPVQSVMVKGNVFPDKKESSDTNSIDPTSTATQNKESLTCDASHATNTSNSDSANIPCNKTDNELPSVATKAVDNEHVNNNKTNCADNNNDELTTSPVNDNSVSDRVARQSDASKNPVYATNQLPVNARPPTLNLNGKRSSFSKDIPLSPSAYEQPPTPEHPPPSPMTAVLGIQERINPKERRRSRDMETITETEYLAAMAAAEAAAASDSSSAVEMRGGVPSRPCPPDGRCDDVAVVTSKNPYHGLTMGSSLASGQRRVKSQILDNVYGQGLKRISVPSGLAAFDPVIERAEELESALKKPVPSGSRIVVPDDQSKRMSVQQPRTKLGFVVESKEKVSSPDETEEWAKIEDLITSIGGGLDTDMLVKEFDERMSSVLLATGVVRVLSVSDWLENLDLPQYENLLVANGFDDTDFLGPDVLEEIDLEEIGISDRSHRQNILEAAAKFPPIKPFSDSQHSVREWLESIRLLEYLDTLIKHGFHDLERIKKLWEVELTSILDITMLGHRKRILASLKHFADAERRNQCTNSSTLSKTLSEQHSQGQDDADNAQLLHDLTPSQELAQVSLYKDYTNIASLSRVAEQRPTVSNLDEIENKAENVEMAKGREKVGDEQEASETLEASVSHWCHRPEALVKGCCNYNVQYLGSTLVTLLDGTESTKASISKFKRSTEHIAKVPNIILSISYRGVKFIDAKSKKVICEHEIGNIFCACQDGDSLNFFAYITRDLISDKHYCHVFTVDSTSLATEIILTLGEAFEVAYQIAVTERNHQAPDSNPELHGPEEDSNAVHNTDDDDSLETSPAAAHSNCFSTAI